MKKYFLISVLLMTQNIWAQQDSSFHLKTSVSGNYQSIAGHSFFGASVDLNHIYRPSNQWLTWGLGLRTGLLMTGIQKEESLPVVNTVFLAGKFGNTQLRSSGNLFLMPFEVYGLIGHRENFLEIGAGMQWAQFTGKREHIAANESFLYEVQDYQLFPSLHIGYAHIPVDNGVTFRAMWKPLWANNDRNGYESSYLIGLGYSF